LTYGTAGRVGQKAREWRTPGVKKKEGKRKEARRAGGEERRKLGTHVSGVGKNKKPTKG